MLGETDAAMGLFEEKEKFDQHMTMRGPKSLRDRVESIAKAEGTSENRVKVTLMKTGVTVHEWVQRQEGRFDALKRLEGLSADELVVRLLGLGISAYEREWKGTKR